MTIDEYFAKNNFSLIDEKKTPEFFGNYELTYKKDGLLFFLSSDRGQKFLEIKKEGAKESISLSLIFDSDNYFSENKIVKCLTDKYSDIVNKMYLLTDEDIRVLKMNSVKRRLNL